MPPVPVAAVPTVLWTALGAACLLWPAYRNGFPILFADSGTYLSQAMRLYAGWDRPPVYSALLRLTHWDRVLWPAIVAQAVLVAWSIRLAVVRWTRWPPWAPAAACAALSSTTALGLTVSRLLPDVFAGVIVIVLLDLLERQPVARVAKTALAGMLIATHQSYLPLAAILLAGAACLGCSARRVMAAAIAPGLAAALLVALNAVAFHKPALSPFGSVFLLARAIEDGPARRVLAADCPRSGWHLCGRPLAATADAFLWRPGALADAGGPKMLAAEAGEIVRAAWLREPAAMAHAFLRNGARQSVMIDPADGLAPWAEVGPALAAFPPDQAAGYAASRQARGTLTLPPWFDAVTVVTAVAGAATLGVRAARRDARAALILLAILANAAVTGGLSGPHPRYESRIVWLAPLFAMLPPSTRRA